MMIARFITFEQTAEFFRGRTVAIVGSAPSCRNNKPGFVDGHDVVVRINNYRCDLEQGNRCDVFYSFFGSSIRKASGDLQRDGVRLCMCKCPDAQPIESDWHRSRGKLNGIDFRYIYRDRQNWWFADTYIPDVPSFVAKLQLLGGHIPTTGFAAILDVLECAPASVYLTGFDFFASGIHNVDEKWRPGDPADPIGHRPALEAAWLAENAGAYPITFDAKLQSIISELVPA